MTSQAMLPSGSSTLTTGRLPTSLRISGKGWSCLSRSPGENLIGLSCTVMRVHSRCTRPVLTVRRAGLQCQDCVCGHPGASVRAWRYRPAMPADHPAGQEEISRPRVVVSVTATADGRVTLSRMERLLDDGPNLRWKATWPPDVSDLLMRRAAAI